MRSARILVVALTILATERAFGADPVSTLCGVREVVLNNTIVDLELVGCGEGFTENVLWHLDRADSSTGVLDSKVARPGTGKGSVVYVIDTGILAAHDEFMRSEGSVVIGGIQPVIEGLPAEVCPNGDDPAVAPCENLQMVPIRTHGSAVASIIAGRNSGVAPDARLVSVYMINRANREDHWIAALDGIIRHAWDPTTPQFRTAVVNMSYFINGDQAAEWDLAPVEQKIREMVGGVDEQGRPDPNGKRFLFVTIAANKPIGGLTSSSCDAAGNVVVYPAVLGPAIDGLITVGGIDETNEVWSGGCDGPAVEILAPATDLLVASSSGTNRYRGTLFGTSYRSGTSYAGPYVAGLAAVLLEKEPNLTPAELEQRIRDRASYVSNPAGATASGRVAVYEPPVPQGRRRRAVRH